MKSTDLIEFQIAENCRLCVDVKSWRRRAVKAAFAPVNECPPDKEALGRATWTLLHTIAAYYPETPNRQDEVRIRDFINTLSHIYPCGHCASHFREEMIRTPPITSSRETLSLWMCSMHNKINELLGKPIFDCGRVRERWFEGPKDDDSCT
jgi:FAD-linked sulfhydryl oxidase